MLNGEKGIFKRIHKIWYPSYTIFKQQILLYVCVLVTQSCLTLRPHGLWPTRLLCLWDSLGKEYWSGLPFPSPEGLPTQESNPSLPHWGQILYHLSHLKSDIICSITESSFKKLIIKFFFPFLSCNTFWPMR